MSNRVSSWVAILLLCSIAVLLVTCAKEYSYEGGAGLASASGTAVFSFVGTGGACLGNTVNGKYYAGTVTDAGNTVQLQVDVSVAGTYTITTSSVNGFRFTATGVFTKTGVQSVVLGATGTPTAEGSTGFKTPVDQGCSFTVLVEKAPPVLAGYSFVSAGGICTGANVQGNYVRNGALNGTNLVILEVNVASPGQYSISTDTVDNIYFNATGSFTATGVQTVTLAGNGIPAIADSVTLTPAAAGIKGCSFSLAVINGDPMATYVLESGQNTCVGLPVGNYVAGQALTTANSISINVYVTVVGNYTVASQTLNGIRFYSSGTFTALGAQKLLLQGTGQPLAAGDFYFIPKIIGPHPLGGQACGFTLTVK
jgi:hypothetical protein